MVAGAGPEATIVTIDLPGGFLFIDADHTKAGVRSDYQMYSPLVQKSDIVLLHDMSIIRRAYGVRKLRSEISPQYEHREFTGQPIPNRLGLPYR